MKRLLLKTQIQKPHLIISMVLSKKSLSVLSISGMKILLTIIVVGVTNLAIGQNEACDGSRYRDDVFSEVQITSAIKYGENTEIFGTEKELFFDVYEPKNDVVENRPVIIVAFGGSFILGTREDVGSLCEAYARKGYVAVAIDYRLFDGPLDPPPTAIQMQEVVIKAVSDMKAVVRFLRQDADNGNTYSIDPDMIFTSGISAGGIAACHTAVLDSNDVFEPELQEIIDLNGGLEGTTNDIDYSSEVQGYINFSGGLADASWMDENDPPFYSVHDEFDGTVPYGEGFASVFGIDIIYMEGSKILQETGDSLGIVNKLKTIEFSPIHVSYFAIPANATAVIDESARFVSNIVCETPNSTNEEELAQQVIYPNPTNGLITIGNNSAKYYNVNVLNSLGQLVLSKNNVNQIDISENRNGIYNIQIMDPLTKQQRMEMVVLAK